MAPGSEKIFQGPGLLLFAAAAVIWLVFFRLHRALGRRFGGTAPLRLPEGLLYFAAALLSVYLAGALAGGIYAALEGSGEGAGASAPGSDFAPWLFLETGVRLLVGGAALALTFRARGAAGLASLGLPAKGLLRGFFFCATGYVVFYPAYAVVCWLASTLVTPYENQRIVQWMLDDPRLFRDVPVLLAVTAAIPLFEELLFRGYLFTGLRTFFGPLPAVLLSAAVFGVIHEVQAWIPVFALGCMLGYLRERTGSLWPSFFMHGLHNGLTLFLAFHMTGG